MAAASATGHSMVSLAHDGFTSKSGQPGQACAWRAPHALRRTRQPPAGQRSRFGTLPARIRPTPVAVKRSSRSEYAIQPTSAVSGTHRKSIGTTTVASACCIALAKQ